MSRLLCHLPRGASDLPALITAEATLTWGELRADNWDVESGLRFGICEPNSASLVRRLIGLLDQGGLPVLAHPRWPSTLVERSFLAAGVGQAWRGEALATLLFTSGSTSDPKIVAHTLNAHLAAAKASNERTPFGAGDRWLLSLPLCHVGGLALIFRAVVGGAALALPTAKATLERSIREVKPTHVSLVATQLRALLADAAGRAALSGVREVLLGGGPCSAALIMEARAANVAVRQTYGMTEFASQISTSSSGDPTNAGTPLNGYEVRVASNGSFEARGPGMCAGYLVGDELHDPTTDGWFATGDTGSIDSDGCLHPTGRLDNQFISGGENVAPEAVEALFAEHGHDVIVVAIPDAKFGARPVAFTASGEPLDELARELLPDFMRPIAWLSLGTSSGLKPRRADLAARARHELM